MNMLVERGRVPITPANDERVTNTAVLADSQPQVEQEFDEYEQIRREVKAVNVFEWQRKQLEVAAVIGIGPPRSL